MPAGVGVLGAERRAEGVDLRQRHAIGLDVELAGHGEKGLAPEEILREIDLAVRRAGKIHQVERRDAEQLAGALRVGRRDDRRVHPHETVVVEEAVDRLRDGVAHARHRADDVGARPQVRDLAQKLQRVRLGLDRIGVGVLDPAQHPDRAGLHLERLTLGRRGDDHAGRLDGASGRKASHLVAVVCERVRRDDLDGIEAGAIGDIHEGNAGLRVTPGSHPALDRYRGVLRRAPRENSGATERLFHRCFVAGPLRRGSRSWAGSVAHASPRENRSARRRSRTRSHPPCSCGSAQRSRHIRAARNRG